MLLQLLTMRLVRQRSPEDVQPACWTRLLPLEPTSETRFVENMVTWKFFGARGQHFLAANDANVVSGGKLLLRGVRVPRVHVMNCPPGHNHVVKCLFETPHCQVHRPHGEQR